RGSLLTTHPYDSNRVFALLNIPLTSHRNRTILFQSLDAGDSWIPVKQFRKDESFESIAVTPEGVVRLRPETGDPIGVQTSANISDAWPMTLPALLGSGRTVNPLLASDSHDVDNIAVIEDDGSIVSREFSLSGASMEFHPNGDGSYDVLQVQPQFETDTGTRLQLFDDDSLPLLLPFDFPFYLDKWNKIYVNSNGSASFQ